MKSFFKIIFLVLFILLVGLAIAPIFLPKKSKITLTQEIKAPVGVVFDEVNTMKKHASWNALLKKDSMVSIVYFSPYKGKNSGYKWISEIEEVGKGEVLITQQKENVLVKNKVFLNTENPLKVTYSFKKKSKTTELTWTVESPEWTYFQRYLGSVFESKTEKLMIESLKILAKKLSGMEFNTNTSKNIKPEEIIKEFGQGEKLLTAFVETDMDTKIFAKNVEASLSRVYKHLTLKSRLSENQFGKPTIYYETWDDINKTTKIYVGYPVYTELDDVQEGLEYKYIKKGNVLKTLYTGKLYDTKAIYNKIIDYALINNIEIGNAWEVYETPIKQKDSAKVYIYHYIIN